MPFKIQKYCILDQCAKIDYFRNPYEICVHTNDQNRWDSKGSSATPAKQPRLSLSTSTVNVCCCHWRRGNYFVCCGVYKGAFRASTSIWEFCSSATKGWKKSLIPASNLNGGYFDKMMNACWHFSCNSWTLPFWNWRKNLIICRSVSVLRSLD